MTDVQVKAFEMAAKAAARAVLMADGIPEGEYHFQLQSPREDDGSYYILRGTVTV